MRFDNLNSEQNKAVEQLEGPVLILAGAGSGKTTTMTHRIANMISQGVEPYNILAVTFTNKAANEMKDRVIKLVGDKPGMWIMTFHALCLRMLRSHADLLGYEKGFTVYDETDKKSLIKKIIKGFEWDEKEHPVSRYIWEISDCKENEQTPETVLSPFLSKVYAEYDEILRKNNAMDFDDLLLNGVRLLEENPDVLKYYSDRFHYIMVDEYQDTNYLQYKLIKMLAEKHGNLCVVGDDDQCIYQWRGADVRYILDFERDFKNVVTIRLEQNYRSDANILNLANSVIKNNTSRKEKTLWTDKPDGEKITYRRLNDEKEEAWYIGGEIERLHNAGYKYSDMAILYRKHAQSRTIEEKLMFRQIPYKVLAGMRYYDRKEIKDVLSYLRLIENPNDNVAMMRVINEPKRGVGAKTLASIETYATVNNESIFEALCDETLASSLSTKAGQAVSKMIEMIRELQGKKDTYSLTEIYDEVLEQSGYLAALKEINNVESDIRIENIMEFKSVIEEFENSGYELDDGETYLSAFLENITLMSEIDNHNEDDDAVVMMTLHAAKGLEFPIVFMPGMEYMIFPGAASYDSETKMEEERRLCYVGITRAMKKLYLTNAIWRMMYGKSDYTTESNFLSEMDSAYLDGDKLSKDIKKETGGLYGDNGYLSNKIFAGHILGTADGYADEPVAKPWDNWKIGDVLRHPKFGEGMLVEQDEKTMTIIFDSVGQKKIGKGFVKMTKVR